MNVPLRKAAWVATLSLFALACADETVITDAPNEDVTPQSEYLSDVLDYQVPPDFGGDVAAVKGPKVEVTICHKFGTPAEKTMTLPMEGALGHVSGHGDFFGACAGQYIDVDGTASPGDGVPGGIDVSLGDPLLGWPTGMFAEGLDWFDNDGDCVWTMGDDLHVEGPRYATALRDGWHQNNQDNVDPIVLDLDGSLVDGQQVDVDMESGTVFTGCPGPDPLMKFFDANGNGFWDNGEDIVLDLDGDGIFN